MPYSVVCVLGYIAFSYHLFYEQNLICEQVKLIAFGEIILLVLELFCRINPLIIIKFNLANAY